MVRDSGKPPVRGKTSPYGFFVKMCYEEHKKKYPNENVQVTEISKKCSEKWKTMTDDEKRRFYELAQKDAERYQAEVAAYGGEEAMRKRKRAKKDPNAPKRALSAFFFFSSQKRPEVQAQNPDWKVGQVAQELGRRWKDLTEEEKKAFEEMAVRDKNRYEQEMRDYKETGKKPASRMETNAAAMAGVGLPSGSAHLSVVGLGGDQGAHLLAASQPAPGLGPGQPQQQLLASSDPSQAAGQPGALGLPGQGQPQPQPAPQQPQSQAPDPNNPNTTQPAAQPQEQHQQAMMGDEEHEDDGGDEEEEEGDE